MHGEYRIRLKVRAAVVADDHLLLVEYGAGWHPHFNLPGGAVEPNETLQDALKREVREETCGEVHVERLLMVCEFNARHPTFDVGMTPIIELIFGCSLAEPRTARLPAVPDPHQVAVRWIPLADVQAIPLRPKIGDHLVAVLTGRSAGAAFYENLPMK